MRFKNVPPTKSGNWLMSAPPFMPPYKPPPYAPYNVQQYPPQGYPPQQDLQSGSRLGNQKRNNNDRKKTDTDNQEPIHTVFFYNLPFDMEEEDVRNFVNEFGDVTDFFAIMRKGYAFVTYNDFREAVNAKEHGSGREVGSEGKTKRICQVNYATPKESGRKVQIARCSTITLFANPSITIDDARNACSVYGEVRSIRVGEKENTFVVKFFKLKVAKEVAESKSINVNGIDCKVEYKLGEDEGIYQRDQNKPKNHSGQNQNHQQSNYRYPNQQAPPQPQMPPQPQQPYMYPGQQQPPQFGYPNYPYPPQYPYPGQPQYPYPPNYGYPPQYGIPPPGYPGMPMQPPPQQPHIQPPFQQPPLQQQQSSSLYREKEKEEEKEKEKEEPRKEDDSNSQGLLQLLAESLNNL